MFTYAARVLLTISCGNRSAQFESVDLIELPGYLPPVPGLEIWLDYPCEGDFFCKVEYPSYSLDDKSLLLVCVREYGDDESAMFQMAVDEFISFPFWQKSD